MRKLIARGPAPGNLQGTREQARSYPARNQRASAEPSMSSVIGLAEHVKRQLKGSCKRADRERWVEVRSLWAS